MKKIILILTFLLSISVFSQEKAIDSIKVDTTLEEPIPFEILNETPPLPPSCENILGSEEQKQCLGKYLHKHVTRKFNVGLVKDNKVKGKVKLMVRFIINTEGDIDEITVDTDYDFLRVEAIRVFGAIPKMKPGIMNGKPKAVKFTYPISLLGR